METKDIRISLLNHKRLAYIGHKNDSFDEKITKVLDFYEEYHEIKDLIEADKEFEKGEGVRFPSSKELNSYLGE